MCKKEKRGTTSQFYIQDAYTGNESRLHESEFCVSENRGSLHQDSAQDTVYRWTHCSYQLSIASDRPHCTSIGKHTNTI